MGKYEILATTAGVINLISFSSLLHNVYFTNNTESLTWVWVLTNIIAQSLFLAYGIINKSYGIYLPTSFFILGLIYILFTKILSLQKTQEKTKDKMQNANQFGAYK
jgi:uncharacterized protein with PQ loop repeat